MMNKLDNKTIVITGATSGIGNALVREFVDLGWKVFAGYRNEALKVDLKSISANVVPFYIDMSKKESVSAAVKFILFQTGHIDTVINAAGYVVAGPMEYLDMDKIREQFEVNTFSHVEFVQRLMPALSHSKIVNISSMASFGIFPFVAPYCASKRALDILFNSMQLEFKRNDIKIISIKPGVIKTPLWDKSIKGNVDSLEGDEKYKVEFEFLAKNAEKNKQKGLEAQAVVDLIVKINSMKHPKPSYTIGKDAKVAEIVSRLPQDFVNFVVRKVFEKRVNYR